MRDLESLVASRYFPFSRASHLLCGADKFRDHHVGEFHRCDVNDDG